MKNIIDYIIIVPAFLSLSVFLVSHLILFRIIDHSRVLRWLKIIFLISGMTVYLITLVTYLVLGVSYDLLLYTLLLSFCLYGFLVLLYVLGIFGVLESSIRINILKIVDSYEEKGITLRQLFFQYNHKIIIKKRLERFIQSKEITVNNGKFMISNHLSYFMFHAFMYRLMQKLYKISPVT